jgi:catechol 2,3-dioxygenase-like lactoylglutathione lyase family enzyme
LPAALRCPRVAFSIFLCFFLRIRLRRFLISDPMTWRRLGQRATDRQVPGIVADMGHRITAIDHVQLAMPPGEEEAATAFYQGVLGLERRPKPEALTSRGGCWFSNGTVEVHLGVEAEFRPAAKAHPALVVDELDDLVAALASVGHPVRFDDEIPGVRRCYADDPFGNRIELIDARTAVALS